VEFDEKNNFIITTLDGKSKVPADEILAERCLECRANFPVINDILFGEKVDRKSDNRFKSLEKIESLSKEKRWGFWKEQLDKCIRCYACRSVCPMCYCDECVVDTINFAVTADTTAEEKAQRIKWVEKSPATSENFVYHLVRAIHLAGRCIDCGECERVCPMDIPLRFLNKKMEKEAKELFDYDAGFDPDQPSLVSCFKDEDPEDFIR
ncbi:MAG: 4Fe-4S dicluster domain-containing protein, partial [Candidatus Aminicenantes bacterium]|nr:4Fe-4S dicluster domain-containing protein [Candidatus Aminicenantes bacterium]